MQHLSPEQFGYRQELRRSLNTFQLTAFGLNYMIPLSPAIFFGFVLAESGGSVALPFIIAGIAIFFTAMSYAVMVQHYPLAGSLYNFIARVWGKRFGFIAGWVLLLDYLFITTVTSMSASAYIVELLHVSYIWVLLVFILGTGCINLLGIQLVVWVGMVFLGLAECIVLLSFIIWSHAIISHMGHITALWNSAAFHVKSIPALMGATSLAIASYLGFDAITTLAEEARQPTRAIPRAIFFCIGIGGIGMILTGYLALLAYPNWQALIQNPDWQATALFHIARATGGEMFAQVYAIGFIISMAVFNIVATAATARLLFGMGRDHMLNAKVFAVVNRRWQTPHWNILLIMVLSFGVGSIGNIAEIASLVNFGALFGFAALNLAVISLYVQKKQKLLYQNPVKRFLVYVLCPALGFLIIGWVFVSLTRQTHICGTAWLLIGLIYLWAHARRAAS